MHARALEWGVPVQAPARINDPEALAALRAAALDLYVVAEYGQILSQALLDIPPLGSINVHGSLLPRWRGATPVEAAILAGDPETGVSVQRVVRKLDAGDVLALRATPIGAEEDAGSLRSRLSALGGELAAEVGAQFAAGSPPPAVAQDESLVTVCRRLGSEDLELDWTQPASELARQVRAFRPRPLARACWLREAAPLEMKILQAAVVEGAGEPGVVLRAGPDGIDVASGNGALRLLEVVPAARLPLAARDFVNGFRLSEGERFGRAGAPR